ncbi:exosome complex component RRP46 [Culicoides brevitarsis]|uniref:exosome complex component RRP46 n=1 Tax=Culicoides brevitarsis TaxID=469753 RepID=UPI00307C5257
MTENKEQPTYQLREMKAELGLLTKSDGSAMFAQGKTTVLANVNGPVEVSLQNMNIEKAFVEVYYRPKSGLPSVDDRFMEKFVKQSIEVALYSELHPRTSYRIQLQELENRGGVLACAVNTVSLALLNSGLEQKYLVAAVYCAVNEEGEIHVDPDLRKDQVTQAQMTFVFDSLMTKAVAVHTEGTFTMEQYKKAMDLCRSASEKVFEFYRDIIKKTSVLL